MDVVVAAVSAAAFFATLPVGLVQGVTVPSHCDSRESAGWMDEWVGGWMIDGWMVGWINGWMCSSVAVEEGSPTKVKTDAVFSPQCLAFLSCHTHICTLTSKKVKPHPVRSTATIRRCQCASAVAMTHSSRYEPSEWSEI